MFVWFSHTFCVHFCLYDVALMASVFVLISLFALSSYLPVTVCYKLTSSDKKEPSKVHFSSGFAKMVTMSAAIELLL